MIATNAGDGETEDATRLLGSCAQENRTPAASQSGSDEQREARKRILIGVATSPTRLRTVQPRRDKGRVNDDQMAQAAALRIASGQAAPRGDSGRVDTRKRVWPGEPAHRADRPRGPPGRGY